MEVSPGSMSSLAPLRLVKSSHTRFLRESPTYGIAELVYGAADAGHTAGRDVSFEYPDYAAVHATMTGRKNMTMVFQWNRYVREYEETGKKSYSYRQFCANYEAWCRENEETIETTP